MIVANSICTALLHARVVPVLRLGSCDQTEFAIDCLLDAGFGTVEITMTTPGALELLRGCRSKLPEGFLLGAGTVLDCKQARQCIDAGADYLVTPCMVAGVAAIAHEAERAALIGAFTPSEVHAAINEGSDIVKLFPASSVGPSHLAALRAIFPKARFCPTGGINAENLNAYFSAGADLVGVGNSILDKKSLAENDRAAAAASARRYLDLARSGKL